MNVTFGMGLLLVSVSDEGGCDWFRFEEELAEVEDAVMGLGGDVPGKELTVEGVGE